MWGTKFEGADRFVPVLEESAYCDKETGLVWDSSPIVSPRTWGDAVRGCTNSNTGGRKGWALPRLEELASLAVEGTAFLIDKSSALCIGGGMCLPDDHPFQNVQPEAYWSVTSLNSLLAGVVDFEQGELGSFLHKTENSLHLWCMRGGHIPHEQDVDEVLEALPDYLVK